MKNKYFFSIASAIIFTMIAACSFDGQSANQNEANNAVTAGAGVDSGQSVENVDATEPNATDVDTTESDIAENDTTEVDDAAISDAESEDAQELTYKLTDTMQVEEAGKLITQTDTVNGITYSLTVNLESAAGYTSEEQIITCTKLFWYCYPKMYEKMAVDDTPRGVNLIIEDQGYEIAEQWDNYVHLHDRWLYENPKDFDCLTHEFAHVIQTGWDGDYSPRFGDDTYLIERFADACRFIFAYEDGLYNDEVWNLCTPYEECDYASSVRFWVWIEKTYSTDEADIFTRLVRESQIKDEAHEYSNWDSGGPMWDVIFAGTEAYGRSLDDLWSEFIDTEFAWSVQELLR